MEPNNDEPAIYGHHAAEPIRGTGPNTKRWMLTRWGEDRVVIPLEGTAYATWGMETCPDTGRVHTHIYIRLEKKCRMSTLKNRFNDSTLHCEPARGTESQCRDYCWCEGDHIDKLPHHLEKGPEIGTFSPRMGKGVRSDLEELGADVKAGQNERFIAEKYTSDFIRYSAGIRNLIAVMAPKPPIEREVEVIVLWGPTGTGKTHRCMVTYPDLYVVKPGRDPWGLYRGEKTILFDEFDAEAWKITDMNRYLDKWRTMLDARYNDRYAVWERVLICANSPPQSWWPTAAPLLKDAFMRRIRGHCYLIEAQDPPMNALLSADVDGQNPYLYPV